MGSVEKRVLRASLVAYFPGAKVQRRSTNRMSLDGEDDMLSRKMYCRKRVEMMLRMRT